MVLRRRAGETGEEDYYSWQDQGGRRCGQGREMPMRGRAIASVVGGEHPDPCRKPLVALKPAGPVKQQQAQQNTRSRAELRLISKYMLGARPVEEGGDEVALRNLVKSTTFKKFVQRLELENEVVELHEQLEREVELHSTLQSAVAHVSSASQLPESLLHGLPSNVQRLLTDIAMLEATVLRLETQASALQWDIGHARTERESIEHSLHVASPVQQSPLRLPPGRLVPLSPKLAPAQLPRLPNVVRTESLSPANNNPKSPTLATLKELLHTSVPEVAELQQFKFCTAPKSPRGSPNSPRPSLRSLWSALDGQPQTPILQKLNAKDRARIHQHSSSPDATTTCFPSSAAAGAVPSNVHHQPLVSPFTPGEPPRTSTTPVTPAAACQQPDSPPTRKLLNPARLLVSTKRLAFWNFSSSSVVDDAASLNNRSANPTPEPELQHLSSSPPEQQHDCISILDEDFTDDVRMRKLRRSRGMKRPDQCLSSPRESSYCSSDISSPRKSLKESPRPSCCVGVVDLWSTAELPSNANRVSEEMVRCMVDIYCHLAEPGSDSQGAYQECPLSPSSHTGRLSTSSSMSSSSYSDSSLPFGARSPDGNPGGLHGGDVVGCEATSDPYTTMDKLPWANIGPYTDAYEVPWLSVGKHQLEYVAHSLGKFRLLVERLAKVEPSAMTHEQKLAFWINLYNALLMHAFLAYGIPRSDLKFFTLMQKAAYCVGGHWFNAAAIECNLLKAKIMLHRPQFALIMALHSKKLTEEQSRYGIEKAEPKVHFALSCGGRSSPMVRIYTPEHVHDELDTAFQDYLRATVGLTPKGRVLLPKLVYNYARDFADDDDGVLDWVCRFLPVSHVTLVYDCLHQQQQQQQRHGQRRLWTHSSPFSVAPYSFAFRYLFPRSISTDQSHLCS